MTGGARRCPRTAASRRRCARACSRRPTRSAPSGQALPDGATVLAEAGAVPADAAAAAEFYERTTADASLDVHRIAGGETRTIVPPEARCDLSVRLAPARTRRPSRPRSSSCCAARCPPAPSCELRTGLASPSRFDPATPAAADRPRRVRARLRPRAGARPNGRHACRSSRASPSAASRRSVSGFGLPQDNFHAPDESFSLNGLGARAALGARALRGPRCGSGARRLTRRLR